MNILDIIILIPIAYGLVRGLIKGFVHELTSLVAIVAGVLGAKLWAAGLALKLAEMLTLEPKYAQPLSYVLLFVAIALSLHLIGKLFEKILKAISLGGINKVLGALFGAIKLALLVSIIFNCVEFVDSKAKFIKKEIKENSVCYKPVIHLAGVAWDKVTK